MCIRDRDDFGKGAFSMVVVEGLETKEVADLKEKIQQVDHVESVIWYDSLMDLSVPMELLPEKYYDAFNNGDATVMAVFFDTSTSADETMEAITQIRQTTEGQCFVSGMSAMVTDLKALCEQEEPIYVGLAVLFATIAMMLFLDSWILPFIFLASIGMAILYNLGSNFMLGEISYVTKALAAVLQLAVTMDYSIFLWHSYSEEKCNFNGDRKEAMAQAIEMCIRDRLNIISISHLQVVLVFSPLIGIVEAVIIPFNFHHGYSIQTVSLSHLGQEEADCIVKVFSFT